VPPPPPPPRRGGGGGKRHCVRERQRVFFLIKRDRELGERKMRRERNWSKFWEVRFK
jgi:hypothetical protein